MKYVTMVLVTVILVGCSQVTAPANLPTTPASSSQSAAPTQSVPKPQVVSFTVTTSEGTHEAPAAGQTGPLPRRVVTRPEVKLHAVIQNADAVRFVIGSLVTKDGPIQQLGPFKPDSSGTVDVEWKLPQPAFAYTVWAEAVRKPTAPPTEGDMVDSLGNLVAASGAVRLELSQGN